MVIDLNYVDKGEKKFKAGKSIAVLDVILTCC
jgi:hypothetical protein